MPGYAAFLRGVNLAGRRKVSGAELRRCFEGIGLEDVGTFRNSGNVVFEAGEEDEAELRARIERALERACGFDVQVFLRDAEEIRAIAQRRPFEHTLAEGWKGKLQVSLLAARPAAGVPGQVLALAGDDDLLAFGERELYWLPSGGTRDSALDWKAIGKLLGSTTMRTKGTVERLAARYFEG